MKSPPDCTVQGEDSDKPSNREHCGLLRCVGYREQGIRNKETEGKDHQVQTQHDPADLPILWEHFVGGGTVLVRGDNDGSNAAKTNINKNDLNQDPDQDHGGVKPTNGEIHLRNRKCAEDQVQNKKNNAGAQKNGSQPARMLLN